MQGLVTVECLNDVVGGPSTIIEYLKYHMWHWADRHGFFVVQGPRVIFELPAPDSQWYDQDYLIVKVIARVLPVTPIKIPLEDYLTCSLEPFSESL